MAPPAEFDAINAVRRGLQILNELQADPSAHTDAGFRIAESQRKLTGLWEELEKLSAYKTLHDTLQKLQIDHYAHVKGQIGRLRRESTTTTATTVEERNTIVEEIQSHIDSMRVLWQEASLGSDKLREIPSRYTPEKRWIDGLEAAIDNLESAAKNKDYESALDGVLTIRSIIRVNPVRVNQALRESAETLPLSDLISTFEHVTSVSNVSVRQKYILNIAKIRLEFLHVNLHGRVALHNQWQEVETELWGADDEFEKRLSAISDELKIFSDELKILWRKIRRNITPICDLDPRQAWVKKTMCFADALDSLQDSRRG